MRMLVLALFIFSTTSFAKELVVNGTSASFTYPDKWESYEKMFGIPFIIVGEKKDGFSSNLSITPTTVKGAKFNPEGLKKDQTAYQTGRQKWISDKKGEILRFIPYSEQNGIHSVGVEYNLNKITHLEMSYFTKCNGQMLHLKSMTRSVTHKSDIEKLNSIVSSMKCKGAVK